MTSAAVIPADWERAVAYGDGLFETVLVVDGSAPLWSYHRARLQKSVNHLGLLCDMDALEQSFFICAAKQVNGVIKLIVARSGGTRGYNPRTASACAVSIQSYPLPSLSSQRITHGIKLYLCRQRLAHQPALAGIKHLNRLEQVLASVERDERVADEGLLLDVSGKVVEGVSCNIFIVQGNTLLTPRLDDCGVAGVMRAYILDGLAKRLGLSIQETHLSLMQCLNSDGMFACNSVFGINPVQSIGISSLPLNTKITEQCWQQLALLGYARLYG